MAAPAEVTAKVRQGVGEGFEEGQGRVLDPVIGVVGSSRDNARRRLVAAARRPPGSGRQVAKQSRNPRSPTYSYDTFKVLQKVWP